MRPNLLNVARPGGLAGMLSFHRTRKNLSHLYVLLLSALLGGLGSVSAAAQSAEDQVPAAEAPSAVPLADALRQFGRDSGYDVVFPEVLVAGKYAAQVNNAQTAYDRLDQILAGSGLVPRFTRRNAFILETAGGQAAADLSLDRIQVMTSPFGSSTQAEYRWYGEKLLEASLRVLRQSSELELRAYDFTLYVWLSQDGQVEELQGYGGAANEEALQIATQMLRGAFVGGVPPVNMPQPVGLRIVAQ